MLFTCNEPGDVVHASFMVVTWQNHRVGKMDSMRVIRRPTGDNLD
jgi:hypothetical protein